MKSVSIKLALGATLAVLGCRVVYLAVEMVGFFELLLAALLLAPAKPSENWHHLDAGTLSPEELLQDVARLDALAITAAEQPFEDFVNILWLDAVGDLPQRFGDLVLSRQAYS